MEPLAPIPIPAARRWREFRLRIVPALVFLIVGLAVVLLWRQNVAAPTLIGEVERVHASVSSPKPGTLSDLRVMRLQRVRAGEVIAKVITTDPQILQSSLAVIEAEIRLIRLSLQPQPHGSQDMDQVRLDWMEQRVQLAAARVRLDLAEMELRHNQELFNDKVISEKILDAARTARDTLQTEVNERTAVASKEQSKLKLLDPADPLQFYPSHTNAEEIIRASIQLQEEKLRLTEAELSPVSLTVPMDSIVSAIHHRSGEAIVAGEPIVTVTALNSDRIVGYLREPLYFEPQLGMKVEVRTRSFQRSVGQGEIVQVGAQMEPISPMLLPMASTRLHEVGLPVLVSLPASQKLLPGEIVDLRILPARSSGAGPQLDAKTLP